MSAVQLAAVASNCAHSVAATAAALLRQQAGAPEVSAFALADDALAVTRIERRGLIPRDCARFHRSGNLGRKLLTVVGDVIHKRVPAIAPDAGLRESIDAETTGRLGLSVVLEEGRVAGIFTDGDLRRAIERDPQTLCRPGLECMTHEPVIVDADARLTEARRLIRERNVRALVVTDQQREVIGILDVFDNMQ